MMTPDEQPPELPLDTDKAFGARKSRWIITGALVFVLMAGGAVGVWMTTRGNKDDHASPDNSSLRGNGNDAPQGEEKSCPANIEFLNSDGTTTDQVVFNPSTSAIMLPDCKENDENAQEGLYFAWTAPEDGKVTLAPSTVWVNDACECIAVDEESTVLVQASDSIRVWVPCNGEEDKKNLQPIQFAAKNVVPVECPQEQVEQLDLDGSIKEGSSFPTENLVAVPPGCDDGDRQETGMFFAWQAPANGQVTLHTLARLVQGCRCIPTESSPFDVTAAQVVQVWTPLMKETTQPVQFTAAVNKGTTTQSEIDNAPGGLVNSACPIDFDIEATHEDGTFVESTVLSPRPVCDGDDEEGEDWSEEGIYVDWVAPAAGQVTSATWTIFVDAHSCDCLDFAETFHVEAWDLLRAWTPLRVGQPFSFFPDDE